jgi:hypothetical protein
MTENMVSVRYMVDDVDQANRRLHLPFQLRAGPECLAGVRGGHSRKPAAARRRAEEFCGTTDARRVGHPVTARSPDPQRPQVGVGLPAKLTNSVARSNSVLERRLGHYADGTGVS